MRVSDRREDSQAPDSVLSVHQLLSLVIHIGDSSLGDQVVFGSAFTFSLTNPYVTLLY